MIVINSLVTLAEMYLYKDFQSLLVLKLWQFLSLRMRLCLFYIFCCFFFCLRFFFILFFKLNKELSPFFLVVVINRFISMCSFCPVHYTSNTSCSLSLSIIYSMPTGYTGSWITLCSQPFWNSSR